MAKKIERRLARVAIVGAILVVVLMVVASFVLIYKQSAKSPSTTNGQTEAANLSGLVTRGPTTPTCNDNQSCYSPVADHIIEALDASGNVAATTTTSDTGKYSIRLKPGHYTLRLVPRVGSFAMGNGEVDVTDSPKEFNLTVDSGIR